MESAIHHPSALWIPEELQGVDLDTRYLPPDLTQECRQRIHDLTQNPALRADILQFCPQKNAEGQWEIPNGDLSAFFTMLGHLPDDRSRAVSRIIDGHLDVLEGGVVVFPSPLSDADVNVLTGIWRTRRVIYESMPTDVLFEVQGGMSLAIIHIIDGSRETVEQAHVHNGGRLVICLSDTGELVLPGGTVRLGKSDAVWMGPLTVHSFQTGDFLALHMKEAGFDHEEAFIPVRKRSR